MFRAPLGPSSGAHQLQQQPLVYRRNVVVAVLLAVVGTTTANSTDTPADLNGLVRFARKTNSGFCACAITFQTHSTLPVHIKFRNKFF